MMALAALLLPTLLLLLPLMAGAAEPPRQLRVCGDASEMVPFTYLQRSGAQQGQVAGFNADLLFAVLAPSGRSAEFRLLPWKRCLAEAAAGRHDIVLDGLALPERLREHLLPRSHYKIVPVIMHRRAMPLPALTAPEQLRSYGQCLVQGWGGRSYGASSPTGSRPAHISAAIAMLRAERCDFLFYYREFLGSAESTLPPALVRREDLGFAPVPWMPVLDMHLMVPRNLPHAEALCELLDAGIARLQLSGEADRLLARYLTR